MECNPSPLMEKVPQNLRIIKRIEHTAHNLEADERIALDTPTTMT